MSAYAFIVRPFSVKEGIDFDRVERELVAPALAQLGIAGRTTGEILRQGNIRTDMFERLLTADLVIADMSIHNANVFYELGIRHALRDQRTFLIRCKGDEVPFDLRTDRYFEYDRENPGQSLDMLVAALRETMKSENKDSPVYQLIPELEPPDPRKFLFLPRTFLEELELAEADRDIGKLGLLADELKGLSWEVEGLHRVGDAQFRVKAYEGARVTWERALQFDAGDFQANRLLGTIYQRLGDLSRSDQALRRVLQKARVQDSELAEIHSLIGSNEKVRWRSEWTAFDGEERQRTALLSPYLLSAIEAYQKGFRADQNHYYSGLNLLAILTVRLELARRFPDVWAARFESDRQAQIELEDLDLERGKIIGAVRVSLEAARQRPGEARWADISFADLSLLTSDRESWIAQNYRKAMAGASAQECESVERQIKLYEELALFPGRVKAVTAVIDQLAAGKPKPPPSPDRVIVFTGHRVDAPGRKSPRFQPEAEDLAREMIRRAVTEEISGQGKVVGYAGAASGGDILFHEVCGELGVETQIFLAAARDEYVTRSVSDAGPEWIERFDALLATKRTRYLDNDLKPPDWLNASEDYVWQRNNLWILQSAASFGTAKVALIALWNGEGGDGQGGTADMVRAVEARGGRSVILDARKLLERTAEAPLAGAAEAVHRREVKRVFVSYASGDVQFVDGRLLPLLERAGVVPWEMRKSLQPGDYWPQSLADGIKSSDWLLLVMTPHSQTSEWVRDELHLAIAQGKKVIPLKVEECDPAAFHPRLLRIQLIDFMKDPQAGDKLEAILTAGS